MAQQLRILLECRRCRFNPRGPELEEEVATHSSILESKLPWTEESGGLQSKGSKRVGHVWASEQLSSLLYRWSIEVKQLAWDPKDSHGRSGIQRGVAFCFRPRALNYLAFCLRAKGFQWGYSSCPTTPVLVLDQVTVGHCPSPCSCW